MIYKINVLKIPLLFLIFTLSLTEKFFKFIFIGSVKIAFIDQLLISASLQIKDKKNCIIYFSNSYWLHRPIFTNKLKPENSRLFFYSTNNYEVFENDKIDCLYGYQNLDWNHIFVWNQWQKNFFKRTFEYKGKTTIFGPVVLEDSSVNLEVNNFIAVFDVSPFRDYFFYSLGLKSNFYKYRNMKYFLEDIFEIADEQEIKVVFKMKRQNPNLHKHYLSFLDGYVGSKNIKIIESNISAERLSALAKYSISMPFTSTIFYKTKNPKKNIYYSNKEIFNITNQNIIVGKDNLRGYLTGK